MSHLGSFGAAVREVDQTVECDTFEFMGETFTVYGVIPPMLHLQIGAAATDKIEEAEGLAAIWEAMRCSLAKPETVDGDGRIIPADESEFKRFYRLAVAKRCALEELLRLTFALFEAQAGRPTEEPQGSSPGRSSTSPSSSISSSTHPALAHLRPVTDVLAG
jgi:hypothetical protein